MSKYDGLGDHLRRQPQQEVPMTFAEIERAAGTPLPPSAVQQRAWWSNNPSNSVITKVWLEAGFRTEQVDMSSRKLVFRRVRMPSSAASSRPARTAFPFGALRGAIRVREGTDLTTPADADWGEDN